MKLLSVRVLFIIVPTLLNFHLATANPLESLVMPGEVIKGHKKYESECSNCHEIFSKKGQDKLCLSCHKEVFSDVKKKRGFHGKNKSIQKSSCKTCHTDHQGRNADIVKLEKRTFNHNETDFKLRGRHKVIECTSCHKKNIKFREAKTRCVRCHNKQSPHKKAQAKKDQFTRCQSCHTTKNWSVIKFDHDKTKYKLTGAHKGALCQSCHTNEKYIKTPKLCISCHKIEDVHSGKNGKQCQKCHTTVKWSKLDFDHSRDTRFKLRGEHKKSSCKSCHKKIIFKKVNPNKKKTSRKCYACHSYDDKHNGVFGKNCKSCHLDKGWDKSTFNHNKETKFNLNGQHRKSECNTCHRTKNKKLKKTCVSCHKNDDIHRGNLGTKCNSCHTESSWKKRVKFEHDISDFPLIGMHSAVACEECHTGSGYKKVKKTCVSCHKNKDFHKGKLGNNCDSCHTPNDWGVWFFNHNKQSKFKLRNSHKKIHCHSCHNESISKIRRTPRDCENCHANDDPHNGQFGSRCNECHNTKDFTQIEMM